MTSQDIQEKIAQTRAVGEKWIELYNGQDMKKFVEIYGPDGTVTLFDGFANPGTEPSITDHTFFARHELHMLNATPGRRLNVRRMIPTEDVVIIEADYIDVNDPTFRLPICSLLTVEDGYVKSDHTYLHRADLPGATVSLPGK